MSTNQEISVSGKRNIIRVLGSGSLHIGNQSIDVSGKDNSVTVSASGSLTIGGQHDPNPPKPPKVKPGQIWAHNVLARRYQVISLRGNTARCLVTDESGQALKVGSGKATIQDLTTINIRYAYHLVSGGV